MASNIPITPVVTALSVRLLPESEKSTSQVPSEWPSIVGQRHTFVSIERALALSNYKDRIPKEWFSKPCQYIMDIHCVTSFVWGKYGNLEKVKLTEI